MQFIRSIWNWLRDTDAADDEPFFSTLYPETIRYALSYRAAQIGRPELESLLYQFPYETVYLLTKLMDYDHDAQCAYLRDLTAFYKNDFDLDDLREFVRPRIAALPDGLTTDGGKLAQLSRTGMESWHRSFREIAQGCYDEDPTITPCIVAYTPLIAYHEFVQVYRAHPKSRLVLVMPTWIKDPDETDIGYTIKLNPEVVVRRQTKAEHINGDYFFIDDTIRTEATSGTVRRFWRETYHNPIPENRIRVITDLRDFKGF